MAQETLTPQQIAKRVIMYGFNFEPDFIFNVWGRTSIGTHLNNKFKAIYQRHGSSASLFVFYTELDGGNRDLLVDYILANFKG